MITLTLSNPIPTFNPIPHTRTAQIHSSFRGPYTAPNWVLISNRKLDSFTNPASFPRFNLGLWNVSKRVSVESLGLRNGGDLLSVRCGGMESSENGDDYDDGYYMRKGLELARKAIGCTSPNPMVGCVIVKDGQIVGQGFHPKAGQPHAEVFALRDAGESAENATAYVTLEPCNHYGRTPPCSEALIKAKLKKVVVGMVDPNPIVSSRGLDRLREAGIEVVVGVEEESCKKLNEAFIHKMLYGKPFVALRYSISINGVVSDQLGENASECGGYYSQLLQEYDAVIHAPTSMTQDIYFHQSQEPGARQPVHILMVKDLKSIPQILKTPAEGDFKAIVFAKQEFSLGPQMSQEAIEIVVVDHLSMDVILDYCSRQGFCNVLFNMRGKLGCLEEVLGNGIETRLVQKVVVEVLPVWAESEASSSSSVEANLPQTKRLKNLATKVLGESVLLEAYF